MPSPSSFRPSRFTSRPLTSGAQCRSPASDTHPTNTGATSWTGRLRPVPDAGEPRPAGRDPPHLHRAPEHTGHRPMKGVPVFRVEVGRRLFRVEAGLPEDLVREEVTEACDHLLVHER